MKYFIFIYHKGNLLDVRRVPKSVALAHVFSREDKKAHMGKPLRYNR